ncbi:DHH family phosphoesterase [Velocimicrobium porci]|uniref:Bifunctional oligoribonuclease/PAP phosphatase NrnA n=1 Tax=Velocimicrobium porci TaxID=2606634 RepID=A0A6L5XX61_9FIRM|nr:bifunctional oligoribonuclease/PAP phosphatase NrnA [Velocimicrobium porci]MSS63332.1 bifunctional oligoribonuclease/PAP phosphatase NrnA [Velocimicrobium porci]
MNKILEIIKDEKSIAIAGHVRPDGDCFGSCLAMYQYLSQTLPDRQIDVYLEEVVPVFAFLKDSDKIKTSVEMEKEVPEYDLFISLDCGSKDRLGFAEPVLDCAKKVVNIDHHVSNTKFGNENHVIGDSSSTCEILFSLMEEDLITREIAEALYLGIVHDTGVFRHSCTSRKTMEIAGFLIEKGIPFSKIIDKTFYEKTYVQNQLLGRCLMESIRILDGKVIASCIDEETMKFYGAGSSDLDGIVDQLRVTEKVEVAIFAHETALQEYKVSMRSNGIVNVSKIATYFGGGGHVKAAGCKMKGRYHDVINNLVGHIANQLENSKSERE